MVYRLSYPAHRAAAEGSEMNVEYITGAAGTGKTRLLRDRVNADPNYALLTCTTGIAAVNLNTITVNSALKYFNSDDMADKYYQGRLQQRLRSIEKEYRNLAIDEFSMMEAYQFDLLVKAIEEVNAETDDDGRQRDLGLILSGDFCQLPPVKGEWAFKGDAWPKFTDHITRLTKFWRQQNPEFLKALQSIRAGQAAEGANELKPLVKWAVNVDLDFPGTTIVAKKEHVRRYNEMRYVKLLGEEKIYRSRVWGKKTKEWEDIPDNLQLKKGAYVMILANEAETFSYVNGDCGYIEELEANSVKIKLVRNEAIVSLPWLTRANESREEPSSLSSGVYFDERKRRWILGEITYIPLRLAYATTVHKSQGLTLDRIQVDIRDPFFGYQHMAYVALSRVKSPENLRIVGSAQLLSSRIKIDPQVIQWV